MALTPEQIELRDRVAKFVTEARKAEMKQAAKEGRRFCWCGSCRPGSLFRQEMERPKRG